jgi:hypothetical protein
VSTWLSLLVLLDGLLVGFRAAAGTNGRIRKARFYVGAQALGLAAAAVVVGAGWALALGLAARDPSLVAAVESAATPAVSLVAAYASLALVALALYAVTAFVWRSIEIRTLCSVLVLGPFTLLRPFVALCALALGVAAAPRWEIACLAVFGAVGVGAIEPALHRMHARRARALVGRSRG